MQTIRHNEQESEVPRRALSVGRHMGNLLLGLLLGLLLVIFDRRQNIDPQRYQPLERRGGRQRPLLFFLGILLFLSLIVVLLIGP
jgi:tetrahydromethanopterin S-methyltransferase subunit G